MKNRSKNEALLHGYGLGMFRRLAVSLTTAWLACPQRRKEKQSTRDFQDHLRQENYRRAFSLVTSVNPKAWNTR